MSSILARIRRRQDDGDGSSKDTEHTSVPSQGSGGARNGAEPNGNAEKGNGNMQEQKPEPAGFWDPKLKQVRFQVFKEWVITTLTLMTFILAVLSLYWAVLFHLPENLPALTVYVVNFDAPTTGEAIVGPAIRQLAIQQTQQPGKLGYVSKPPSDFGDDALEVRRAVYEWDAWAAIVVNSNATDMLYSAVQNGNTSYDPLGACQLIYQSSRDQTNWQSYLAPQLNMLMTEATSMVGQMWTRMTLENAASDATLRQNLAQVPQALSPAIGFSRYDLRPFTPEVALPAVTIGLIYLIILSFFVVPFYMPIHTHFMTPKSHPALKLPHLVLWRLISTLTVYLFLSLAYSLVSAAFLINFYHSPEPGTIPGIALGNAAGYSHGTFPVYWMLNYVGMIALGLACENVAMLVGQPWTGLWLIFWVITNVCTSFYDVDLSPGFFRWGYAWPLHHVVAGSRQILFDLQRGELGVNFGVLAAWAAIGMALFPLACAFAGWKKKRGLKEYWGE